MNTLKTKKQAAEFFGCSVRTIDRYIADGIISYKVLNAKSKKPRIRFTERDLFDFMECKEKI